MCNLNDKNYRNSFFLAQKSLTLQSIYACLVFMLYNTFFAVMTSLKKTT